MAGFSPVKRLQVAGQGEIWLARDSRTGTEAVAKYIRPNNDPELRKVEAQRFAREVRCQSQLQHQGIMPILAFDFDSDRPWYAMPGATESLDDLLSDGSIDQDEATSILNEVMNAIEYAHGEGILHRDLKPANILRLPADSLGPDRWVVADFGLCRDMNSDSLTITHTNTVVGSIAYMAPEQFDNAHEVAASADVYALGKILYHCLTGVIPFPYTPMDKVPPKFRYIITRCLAEKPEQRYQTIAELRNALLLLDQVDGTSTDLLERGKELASSALEGNSAAVAGLSEFLIEHIDDETLYTGLLPLLQAPVIRKLYSHNLDNFIRVIQTFDRYCVGRHPFSYTDRIADFFGAVFAVASESDLRRLSLRRILLVGYDHHRFYVRTAFCRIVATLHEGDARMVAELLREFPETTQFIAEVADNYHFSSIVRAELVEPPPF